MAEKVEIIPEKVDITPEKDGGVLKEILKAGAGDDVPGDGCSVFVHYHGTLEDGTVFDSSRERNQEFEFTLGNGQVIKSWDLGVATMKRGELCRLTCAPAYAYGEKGSPPKIPANATLIFEVELFRWKYEDISPEKDESIQRKVLTKGELYSSPGDLSVVSAHLRGTYKGRVFDERDVTFTVGEAEEAKVCKGVEIAVQKMKKGEKSDIILKPKYAFGEAGLPSDGVVPNAEVTYTVALLSFEKAKETWEMSGDEKIIAAEGDKAKGTEHFKASRLDAALKYYSRIVTLLDSESNLEGEEKIKRDALLLAGHLNSAIVFLKQNEHLKCIESCDKALDMDDKNIKAIFRRGQAQLAINEYDLARQDFLKVLELDKDNKAAATQLATAKAKQRAQLEKEKKMFKSMFEQLSKGGEDAASPKTEQGLSLIHI